MHFSLIYIRLNKLQLMKCAFFHLFGGGGECIDRNSENYILSPVGGLYHILVYISSITTPVLNPLCFFAHI